MAGMNMQQMMKQARKMQEQLAAAQENLKSQTVDALSLIHISEPTRHDHGCRQRGRSRRQRTRQQADGRHHRRPQHPGHAVLRRAYI